MGQNEWKIDIGNLHNDEPISDARLFNFETITQGLFQVVTKQATQTPITIGINGKWGTGKTSLLLTLHRMIHEFRNPDDGREVLSIWFNAWQYERGEDLWLAMMQTIAEELQKEKKLSERVIARLKRYSQMTKTIAVEYILKYYSIGCSLQETDNYYATLKKKWETISVISEEFSKLVSEFLNDSDNYYRIALFIDDLDRCRDERVYDVVETLKLLLSAQGCIFLIGADMDYIEKVVMSRYQTITSEEFGVDFGKRYLEKVIQLKFDIPPIPLVDLEAYLQELDFDTRCAELFKKARISNPRQIKRIIGSIKLYYNFIMRSGNPAAEELLTLWILLKFQIPKFTVSIEQLIDEKPTALNNYITYAKLVNEGTSTDKLKEVLQNLRLNPDLLEEKYLIQILAHAPHFHQGYDQELLQTIIQVTGKTIGVKIETNDFSERDFSKLRLSNLDVENGKAYNALFLNTILPNFNATNARLSGSDFSGADISGGIFKFAVADNTNFKNSDLSGSICNSASFKNSDLSGANFEGAVLDRATFQNSNLNGTRFSGSTIGGTGFRGIQYDDIFIKSIIDPWQKAKLNNLPADFDDDVEKIIEKLVKKEVD